MILAILSIIVLTSLVWAFNRVAKIRLCPICAGVAGTWLWMLVAYFLGFRLDLLPLAILMGGSVVGIVYQVERAHGRVLPLAIKTIAISSGFLLAYALLEEQWLLAGVAVIVGALSLFKNFSPRRMQPSPERVPGTLEKEMESCC